MGIISKWGQAPAKTQYGPSSAQDGQSQSPFCHKLLILIRWQRRGSRRGRTPTGADVGCPAAFVFFRCQPLQFCSAAADYLLVQLLEEGDTPAAAGPGAAAFRELACHAGPMAL